MLKKASNFRHFWELLFVFTQKEIKARYKNAVLGFLWIFINPLLQMIIIGFVFSLIFRFGIENYYLFLFTGLLPWNFFSLSVNKTTTSLVFERNLIQKSSLRREVIVLSIIFSNLFHLLIAYALFFVFLFFIGQHQIFNPLNFTFFLTNLFFLLLFTIGISMVTSSLNVFWRDIAFFTQALLLVWFYATPVLYPLSFIPQKYNSFFYLNPLSGIFSSLQKTIIGNGGFPSSILLIQFLFIILFFIFGLCLFKNKNKHFADWL